MGGAEAVDVQDAAERGRGRGEQQAEHAAEDELAREAHLLQPADEEEEQDEKMEDRRLQFPGTTRLLLLLPLLPPLHVSLICF